MSPRSSFHRTTILVGLLLSVFVLLAPQTARSSMPTAKSAESTEAGGLFFIENVGQFDAAARYQIAGAGQTVWLSEDAIWLSRTTVDPTAAAVWRRGEMPSILALNTATPAVRTTYVRLQLDGARLDGTAVPFGPQETRFNYYRGDDPAAWVTDAPVWQGVQLANIYPGVTLELSGAAGTLRARLLCDDSCPTSLGEMDMTVEGARPFLAGDSTLRLESPGESFSFPLPQLAVAANGPAGRAINWHINGTPANQLPQAIHPANPATTSAPTFNGNTAELLYGTFLGGGDTDFVEALAVDRDGRATLMGDTLSADFPTTPGTFDGTYNGGGFPSGDIVVAQLDAGGANLRYATFIGGRGSDLGLGGAIDGSGNIYMTGWTDSDDFPTTNGAFDVTHNGDEDAYVVKLNTFGGLTYGTYLGGSSALPDPDDDDLDWTPSGFDSGYGLAVSSGGVVTIVGATRTPDFPITPGAFDRDNSHYCSDPRAIYPCSDGFVARLSPTGSELLYASYLGGSRDDYARALAVDSSGRATIAGDTFSTDFPVTSDALDDTGGGFDRDAFVARVASNGSSLQYATYLGGGSAGLGWYEGDQAVALALDADGYIYVAGQTWSDDFPTTAGAYDTVRGVGDCPAAPDGDFARCPDGYVVRLRPDGRAFDFSTLLGGSGAESAFFGREGITGLTLDSLGDVVVSGFTEAPGFPTTPGAYSREHNQTVDSFIARLNRTGTVLQYSTFLNSNPGSNPVVVARDGNDDIYLAAQTRSPLAPVTAGAYDVSLNGGGDWLALRLSIGPAPAQAGWLEVGSGSGGGGGLSNTPGESSRPAILDSATNGLVIAWSDGRGDNAQIYVRRWDGAAWVEMGSGSASGGGVSNASGESSFPALAADAQGNPVLAWQQDTGSDTEIYLRRWNGNTWTELGNGSASRGGISDNRGDSNHPELALIDGTLFIVWDDDTKGNLEIYGLAWDGSRWVEWGGSGSGSGISRTNENSSQPDVAALDGRPVVAWTEEVAGDSEIYARRYNGKRWVNAGSQSAEGGGISDNDGLSRAVDLLARPDNILAAWSDESGGDLEIYVLAFDGKNWAEVGSGSARGGGVSVNSGNSHAPSLALGAGNRPIVTWYDGSSGDTEIFGRQWDGMRWAEITRGTGRGGGISDNDGGSSWPAAVVTSSGIPYVAWADNSSGDFEILIRRATTSTCYQLQLRHSGQGSDLVAAPGQSFGCQPGWYTPGSTIQLTAAPDSGWQVAGWDGTVDDSSTSLTNSVIMPAQTHQALVVYSEQGGSQCYRLNLSHLGDGAAPTASPGKVPNCLSGTYPAGTLLTLTANPANGWRVAEWEGTDDDSISDPMNTLTMPAADHTATAIYAQSDVTCSLLRLTFSGLGETPLAEPANSAGCATGRFSPGESVQLTARPATGWQVTAWTGTDDDSLATLENALTMPGSAATVFVQYEPAEGGGSYWLFLPAVGGRTSN